MTDVLASKVASPKAVLAGVTADHTEGMSYLQTLPRRLVTLYLPLSLILFVLLFPFYWMALTAIKPDEQLLDLERFNPFWTWTPTLKHIDKLLFGTHYPLWLPNTMLVPLTGGHPRAHPLDRRQRARGLCDRAAALPGRAVGRRRDLPRLPHSAVDPVHSAFDRRVPIRAVRHAVRADPHLSDHIDPVLDLAVD